MTDHLIDLFPPTASLDADGTLAVGGVRLDEVAASAARQLPFGVPVTELEVIVESDEGHWHRRWRLPLGRRP